MRKIQLKKNENKMWLFTPWFWQNSWT